MEARNGWLSSLRMPLAVGISGSDRWLQQGTNEPNQEWSDRWLEQDEPMNQTNYLGYRDYRDYSIGIRYRDYSMIRNYSIGIHYRDYSITRDYSLGITYDYMIGITP